VTTRDPHRRHTDPQTRKDSLRNTDPGKKLGKKFTWMNGPAARS
jgi:hypothetical protein